MRLTLIKFLFTALLLSSSTLSLAGDEKGSSRVALPTFPQPVGEKCVEPADVMRREHMNMILHQRDDTMHKGIRGITAKYSLKDCIDCHAGYDDKNQPIPINSEGQFCESCHAYTAVSIDCFGCHRTTPMDDNPRRQGASMSSMKHQ